MRFLISVFIIFLFKSNIPAQQNQIDPHFIQQDTIPRDTMFQDTVPQDTLPQDTLPQDTIPQDTIPAPGDTSQQDTTQPPAQNKDTTHIPQEVKNLINERTMEIGLMFGEPTGVNYKYFITDANAVDAAAAVSFIPDAVFQLNADFLRHYFRFANVGEGRLPLVYGAGLAVQFRDDIRWGIRIPVGLAYFLESLPLSLFIDVAPRFDITPDTEVSINAAVGARYRFFPR